MKYLVIGGCSHAVGTGLKEALGHDTEGGVYVRKIYRYSALLSKKLNLEEINLGKDGASNWQIYHNVMNWILENPDKINDSLFIISWTYADRNYLSLNGDFYCGEKLIFRSFKSEYSIESIDYIPAEVSKLKSDGFGRGKSIEGNWDEAIQKNSFLYMIGLTSIFSNQNLKYLHFHCDYFKDNGVEKVEKYKKYINFFDRKNYITDETYRWYCNWDTIRPPKYPNFEGHIGPEGQQSWADYLYQQLLGRGII